MTNELQIAIDNLYSIFAAYPRNTMMQGCPCCVYNTDKEKINCKELRLLEEEDLSKYTFKAMTTWGGVDGFKHYLPRIFELMATTNFLVDTFIILGKLPYGKWQTWPEAEQNAITRFLLCWWSDLINNKTGFDNEAFFEIYTLTSNIDGLLTRWKLSFEDKSFLNHVDFIYCNYYNLKSRLRPFRDLDNNAIEKLIQWSDNNSTLLEQGFFHYTQKNTEVAEQISKAVNIFEKVRY